MQKFTKKPNFRGAETVEIADFEAPDSQHLISRKIWEAGKLPNFHTVKHEDRVRVPKAQFSTWISSKFLKLKKITY